jgi:hypothetical protein
MIGWGRNSFHKKRAGTRYAELVFLHPVGSPSHVVQSGSSEAPNINVLFFKLGWVRCDFRKNCVGTRYAELVFFYPVGSTGHIVHSGPSEARNIEALFFMLECDRYGYHKKRDRTSVSKFDRNKKIGP